MGTCSKATVPKGFLESTYLSTYFFISTVDTKEKVMGKVDIRNCSYQDLVNYFCKIGQKEFRANQVFDWLYKKDVSSFDEMRNLPQKLQEQCADDFKIDSIAILKEEKSKDGTIKVLSVLEDGEKVETVLIPAKKRSTVCVSTQAGCKFGCGFCASGLNGFVRQLTCAEILNQILYVQKKCQRQPLTHIVFMGTGEPLDNYDNVLKAIRIINSQKGLNIAARRITISTCGLVNKIKKLSQEGLQIELSISLHGFDDVSRNMLMPINKRYPLKKLINACHEYVAATKRQITFEYVMIKDVNMGKRAARKLSNLLKGLLCKINLISFNKVPELDFRAPSENAVEDFKHYLDQYGVHFTLRTPRGRDISAACGQLRTNVSN